MSYFVEDMARLHAENANLRAENERLREALRRAQQDINWMLNSEKFLNGWVFDYIDDALRETP